MTQNSINNRASQMSIGDIFITGDTISTQSVNANLNILPNGVGVTSIPNGITFDGTHVLKNYVTSTAWTPVLNFGGATTGITYLAQTAHYLRIGNLIFITMEIRLTSKGSATGDATITGLPFVSDGNSFFNTRWDLITFDGGGYTTAIAASDVSSLVLQQIGNNVSFIALKDTNFVNASGLFLSGIYSTT